MHAKKNELTKIVYETACSGLFALSPFCLFVNFFFADFKFVKLMDYYYYLTVKYNS